MAESMNGLKRSHRCGELSLSNVGETVTVMGWVAKQRNKGGIIFVDLRDRSGILQVIFEESDAGAEGFAKAEKLRSEYVVAVVGKVEKRAGAVNENLATGEIEVRASQVRILSEALTPPFPIEEESKTKEELRLKYRYLDLRRPDLQSKIILRSKITMAIRKFMSEEGFLEIETPMLTKSTPEGARDYLVPSRVHPGNFYALPQSPQIFKQLLMCSGYDRYFQIARCFRDEDLRADRQPEFTQVDMELSFVDVDDVIAVNERLLKFICKDAIGLDVQLPIARMTWIASVPISRIHVSGWNWLMFPKPWQAVVSAYLPRLWKMAVPYAGSMPKDRRKCRERKLMPWWNSQKVMEQKAWPICVFFLTEAINPPSLNS